MEKGLRIKAFLLLDGCEKDVRRFTIPSDNSTDFNFVKSKVQNIFRITQNFSLSWKDEEGDMVTICSDEELIEAIDDCVTQRDQRIFKLFVKLNAKFEFHQRGEIQTFANEEPSSTLTDSQFSLNTCDNSGNAHISIKEEKNESILLNSPPNCERPHGIFTKIHSSPSDPDTSNGGEESAESAKFYSLRSKLSKCLKSIDENQNTVSPFGELPADPICVFKDDQCSSNEELEYKLSVPKLEDNCGAASPDHDFMDELSQGNIDALNEDSAIASPKVPPDKDDKLSIVALDLVPEDIQKEINQLEADFQGGLFVEEGLVNQADGKSSKENDQNQELVSAASYLLGEHPLLTMSESAADQPEGDILAQIEPIIKMACNEKFVINRSNICPECKNESADKEEFITHWTSHLNAKPYKCLECNYRSYQLKLIENHMYAHYKVKRYRCKICSFKTSKNDTLKEHLLSHSDLKPFKCSQCEAGFAQKRSLTIHMFSHTGEKPFKCSECPSAFILKEHLKKHMITHTGVKPFKCVWCARQFAHKFSLKFHMYRHLKLKPYKCAECDMQFTQKGHLNSHMLVHSPLKPFKCTQCEATFTRKETMKRHLMTHSKVKEFKCVECSAEFMFRGSLKRHSLTHVNPKLHRCIICSEEFKERDGLKAHMVTHRGQKPFRCEPCNAEFTQKGSLKRHLLNHRSKRSYSCPSCPLVFKQKGHYDKHVLTHKTPRVFCCPTCNLEYKTKEGLKRHSITHTDCKPYKCTECKAEFTQRWNLKRHRIVHTGVKPFKCSDCDKSYSQRQQLREHQLVHMQFDD